MAETPVYTIEVRDRSGRVSLDEIRDPFINTTIRVKPDAWSRIRAAWDVLLGRLRYEVHVSAAHDVVERVCELDPDYKGEMGSERRRRFDELLERSLSDFGRDG
jgi:hypothetical protein